MVTMPRWTFERLSLVLEEAAARHGLDDRAERKRRRIVKAASSLFVRQGYRRTSVEEIARSAGVAKGTVYLYFGSKTDIMLCAIIEEKRRFFDALRPCLDPALPPGERLGLYLETALDLTSWMPLVSRLLGGDHEILAVLDDLPEEARIQMNEVQGGMLGEMVELAAAPRRLERGEVEEIAAVIQGVVYMAGMAADTRMRGGLAADRFARVLARIIVDGLKGGNP